MEDISLSNFYKLYLAITATKYMMMEFQVENLKKILMNLPFTLHKKTSIQNLRKFSSLPAKVPTH